MESRDRQQTRPALPRASATDRLACERWPRCITCVQHGQWPDGAVKSTLIDLRPANFPTQIPGCVLARYFVQHNDIYEVSDFVEPLSESTRPSLRTSKSSSGNWLQQQGQLQQVLLMARCAPNVSAPAYLEVHPMRLIRGVNSYQGQAQDPTSNFLHMDTGCDDVHCTHSNLQRRCPARLPFATDPRSTFAITLKKAPAIICQKYDYMLAVYL